MSDNASGVIFKRTYPHLLFEICNLASMSTKAEAKTCCVVDGNVVECGVYQESSTRCVTQDCVADKNRRCKENCTNKYSGYICGKNLLVLY